MRNVGRLSFLVLVLFAAGCDSGPSFTGRRTGIQASDTAPSIQLIANDNSISVGETVIIVAKTTNTHGKKADISWYCPDGQLTQQDGGVKALVKAERSGQLSVRATLTVAGAQPVADAVVIEVKPLP